MFFALSYEFIEVNIKCRLLVTSDRTSLLDKKKEYFLAENQCSQTHSLVREQSRYHGVRKTILNDRCFLQ